MVGLGADASAADIQDAGAAAGRALGAQAGELTLLASGLSAEAASELATGLNLTVRNVTTHTRTELSEQEAMERLAAYSYLARLLDRAGDRRARAGAERDPRGLSGPLTSTSGV